MVLAVMGLSQSLWLRLPAKLYTDIFRGLPAIVIILLIGQGFARIGRQIFGPSPYPLGILALGPIAAAYLGEIFRAGIQSVDRGQLEARRALSMSYGQGMRLIVIPHGVRRVLPALVNQFIGNVKVSSRVYFRGLLASEREIFRVGQDQAGVTGNLSPLLLARANYATAYSYAICIFQEMQWIHSAGIHSDEYFHGPFEVTDIDAPFVILRRAGLVASDYMGIIGDDGPAAHVEASMRAEGLSTHLLRRVQGENGLARVIHDPAGDRVFSGSNRGGIRRKLMLRMDIDDVDEIGAAAWVHSSRFSYIKPGLPRIRAAARALSFDFSTETHPA